MSLVSCETPWKPATIAIAPSLDGGLDPAGRDVDDLGLAVRGVGDHAGLGAGERLRLVAELGDRHRDQRHRDPLARGEQHVELRGGGSGVTCSARSRSSSVVSPMAETTTTTSWPALRVATIRWATRLMPVASATDEPPYFCTTMPTGQSSRVGRRLRPPSGLRRATPRCAATVRRVYRGRASSRRRSSSISSAAATCSSSPDELGVEPVVGDHRQQRVERGAREVAPGGDVGELPPPQRLLDVAAAVVAQAVLEVGGDAGQVVGELALDAPRGRRGRRRSCRCRCCRASRPAAAAARRGRARGRRRAGTPRAARSPAGRRAGRRRAAPG